METPTIRGLAGAVWSLANRQTERELRTMGEVRPALMRVVYSPLSNEQAARDIRDVVRSDPPGAKATLAYVSRTRAHACQYDTDRAERLLRAAIAEVSTEPISKEHKVLFERQRELGFSSLSEAFAQLADAVPELSQLARAVESEPPNSAWIRRAERLVGPRSSQSDPLLRSSVALTVATRYLRVCNKREDVDRLRRPVWP